MGKKNVIVLTFIFFFFLIAILSLLVYRGIVLDFIIFRENPLLGSFITDSKNNKINCADVVRMYNIWKKDNEADIDPKFKGIFKNIIDINNSGYHAYYHKSANENKDIIIFFHGVQCCIFSNPFTDTRKKYCLLNYAKDDFDILIVEYPSFSINKKEDIKANFEKVLREVNKWVETNYKNKKKIIIGHSFGCYLSLYCSNLSKEFLYDMVIIVNPFINIQSAAKHCAKYTILYPFTLLMEEEYDCIEAVKKLKTNLLIVKLDGDRICPPDDARTLYDNFNNDNDQKLKCEVIDVAEKDSRSNKYYRHEFPNKEQIFFYAKSFCNEDFAKKYGSYDDYKTELVKNYNGDKGGNDRCKNERSKNDNRDKGGNDL